MQILSKQRTQQARPQQSLLVSIFPVYNHDASLPLNTAFSLQASIKIDLFMSHYRVTAVEHQSLKLVNRIDSTNLNRLKTSKLVFNSWKSCAKHQWMVGKEDLSISVAKQSIPL